MQNLTDRALSKKNYDFIDIIRCLAMMSIVMEHSFSFNSMQYNPTDRLSVLTFTTVIQFIKFGTIAFFLLSGFLISEKINEYPPFQYLKKRTHNTTGPWIFWSLFFCFTMILNDIVCARQFNHGNFQPHYGLTILNYLKIIYLYTSYWFIPNFLICIAVLLIFKRWIYSYWLGAGLMICTAIYMVNIYNEWVEPRHSTAILGFVFFLWLGVQFNRHLDSIEKWLDKTPTSLWVVLTALTLAMGVAEITLLKYIHSVDPYNSLRPSNVLYSLCFFFLLLKIKNFTFLNYLKPRETTYGIYLVHYILVYSLLPVIFPWLRLGINQLSYVQVWCYMISRFIIVYAISFTLVIFISKTKAKWLVGRG